MKNIVNLILLWIVLSIGASGCGSSQSPSVTAEVLAPTTALPSLIKITPTSAPTPISKKSIPEMNTMIITSSADSGIGSLREALQEAIPGTVVTFDQTTFPVDNPQIIYLQSSLPGIQQGYVTVDASQAGVILDGTNIPDGWNSAIQVLSDNNTIRGLTLLNLSGAAIQISGGQDNLIEANVIGCSDVGIGVWGASASGNRIVANQLGVMSDGVTPLGNKGAGILIMEQAHNNLIGPDNQIAFNERYGIEIRNPGTLGNTIFKNSIHDNASLGIAHTAGENDSLVIPDLMYFDLTMGSVSGMACPNCTVSFFSDSGDEGAIFEGQSVANREGVFIFEKGSGFSGPVLTATATDEHGNTSGFSIPTSQAMQFQIGNFNIRKELVMQHAGLLEDNHLGGIWSDFWQPMDFQQVIETEILPAGLKWVKLTMNQPEYYSTEQSGVVLYWDKPELYILPEFDDSINQLISQKITIYYTLNFWDKANHPNGWNVQYRFKTDEDIDHYLEYVRFIVTHFKGRVQYYELWNEPDVRYPLQYIEPEDYINLAKRAIPLIKQIDPQAKVVVGCTSGSSNPQSRDYLFKILNSDLMRIADVVSWHPLYGDIPDNGQNPSFYTSYASLLSSMIDTSNQNGFHGEFLAGEISYGGPDCGGCVAVDPSYSENIWAKYTARGLLIHFGNGVAAGVAGMSSTRLAHFNTIRNIANVFSGVHAVDFNVEVQLESQNFNSFTFAGLDGSRLIAIWTDGVAVDNDPGIPARITLPGFSGWNATGIDLLNGIEQKLITSNENGNLVIRDLLIKDYPLVIRLSK